MPGAHEVAARVLAGAHEIACCLLLGTRHPHHDELAQAQEPREALGVAAVRLHPVARCPRDLGGCGDRARDPCLRAGARESVSRRSRLVGHAHWLRQRLEPRDRLLASRRHVLHAHLSSRRIEHTRQRRAGVHVQSNPATFGHHRRLP